jgi:hypothetical protein
MVSKKQSKLLFEQKDAPLIEIDNNNTKTLKIATLIDKSSRSNTPF